MTQSHSDELPPCPFCGGKKIEERVTEKDRLYEAHNECWDCGARGPSTALFVSAEDAIAELRVMNAEDTGWNTRALSTPMSEDDVERVARAIYEKSYGLDGMTDILNRPNEPTPKRYIELARAALSAIGR